MNRNHERAITNAGDDADALRSLARTAHIRCDNLEKLLVLILKDVGPVKLSRIELAAEMVGGFELNTEDDHCVASWVPHRTDKT